MSNYSRSQILEKAKECVTGKRPEDYGSPENNFQTIADFWNTYIKATRAKELSAKDVAVMMSLLKIARITKSDSIDSFIDLAGYAACAGQFVEIHPPAVAPNTGKEDEH